jgi:predicted phage-related endonuclease
MKDRRKSLGGSDANRIMRGDWHTLWLEKTGRKEPDDLSENLPVQIGLATEDVNNKFFTIAKIYIHATTSTLHNG